MHETIAGISIPDSVVAKEATELVRDTTNELIFNHSRRVFLFGSLQARELAISPDPELLYVSSLFHDLGLVSPYKSSDQRFELDGAAHARDFLSSRGFSAADTATVWAAIALHTTPDIPYFMDPVIASTTAGVETDVLGINLSRISNDDRATITQAHPRPDFKKRIVQTFFDGFSDRPATTFGTVNGDVLEHLQPGFRHIDFVDMIEKSGWDE